MKTARLLALFALLLTLPFYGLAGVESFRVCNDTVSASSDCAGTADQCCAGKSDPGTACKGMQGGAVSGGNGHCTTCKTGCCPGATLVEPTTRWVLRVAPSRPPLIAKLTSLLPVQIPDGLFRPPRLV